MNHETTMQMTNPPLKSSRKWSGQRGLRRFPLPVTLLSLLFFFLAFQPLPVTALQSSAQISSVPARRAGVQGAGNDQTVNGSGVVASAIVPVLVPTTADKYEGKACIYADKRYSEGAVVRDDGATLICAIRENAPGIVHAGPHELAWHVQEPSKAGVRSGRSAAK